jgi:hypothetical protein
MNEHERERDMHRRREEMLDGSRKEVESILSLSGLSPTRMWELANQYWPLSPAYDDVRRPWWLADTSIGLVRIGWRKRVLEIDWSATPHQFIVTDGDVTKDMQMVHAYSTSKAVEYLTRLRELAS